MEQLTQFINDFITDEFAGAVAAHLRKNSDDQIEKLADKLHENYLGEGVTNRNVYRPYKPSPEFFWKDDPQIIKSKLCKRHLIKVKHAQLHNREYYLAYVSDITYQEGPPAIAQLFIVATEPLKIISIYQIDYMPEPHWWHAMGQEIALDALEIQQEKTFLADVLSSTIEFAQDTFLKKSTHSDPR